MKDEAPTLTHKEYLDERKLLYRHQQRNFENFEKTIIMLSSALLAFSVSYIRLFPRTEGQMSLEALPVLIAVWVAFAFSILCILLSFLVSAIAFQSETAAIERAREDGTVLEKRNPWSYVCYTLYFLGGASFLGGIISLILFSIKNLKNL